MGFQAAPYQAAHRIRRWRKWDDRTESLAAKSKRLAGPVRTRRIADLSPDERRRLGL